MESAKRTISPLLYFILISSFTNLVFLVVASVIFSLLSFDLSSFVLQIIIFLLLWKGALVGFLSWLWNKKTNNKDFLVKFIGIYLGRFFGIFIGVFLGDRISDVFKQPGIIGFIVGALVFYFAGRWIGSRVSSMIGKQLDKLFLVPELEKAIEAKPPSRFFSIGFAIYFVLLPWLLVVIGLLMNYFVFPIGTLSEYLSTSRFIAIALSAFSIFAPWLMANHMLVKFQAVTSSSESAVYWLGLTLSIVPTIYGFILFIVMGASIFELIIFASVSSIASIIWNVNKFPIKQKTS